MTNVFGKFSAMAAVVGVLLVSGGRLAGAAAPDVEKGSPIESRGLAEKAAARGTYTGMSSLVDPLGVPGAEARAPGDRAISCDPQAFPEGEANCGLGANGLPNDTVNGGCSSAFQYFFPTFCGDLICGTSAWNGVSRDTDWYELTIFTEQSLTWEVAPDFNAIIGLAGGTNGVPDCQLVTGITPFRLVQSGETDSVTVCLTPGTWWFVVFPDTNQVPFQCGRQYEASLTCTQPCPTGACCFSIGCDNGYTPGDCSGAGGVYMGDNSVCATVSCDPPPNDNLCNAQLITPGEDLIADLRNATLEVWGEVPACAMPGGVASVWYTFPGNGEQLHLSTCNSEALDHNATDSVIAVYSGTCGNPPQSLNFLTCNDDAGCGGTGRLSSMCTFATQIGATYYIQVLAWSDETRGRYALETDYPCSQPDPTGACCIPTTFGPFCDEIDQSACASFDGVFQGPGTSCTNADCSDVEIPANDECDGAIYLTIPSSDLGDTTFATQDAISTDCGLQLQSPGVWYRVQGTGNTITADLCSGNTLFDARMHVFCNNCGSGDWVCVGASDDALDAGCATRPSVSWCSAPGAFYFILVTGTGGEEGLFEINVDDDGVSCPNPVVCDPDCSVTCPGGAVSENEPVCQDDYTDITNGGCGSNPVVYGQLVPGETVCGTSGNFALGGSRGRDVDWYTFTVSQQCDVTWTVNAEFLVETYILNTECGEGLASYAESKGNACQDVIVQTTLEPGDYSILVQPQFFYGLGCGQAWYGTLECVPTPNNGACCLDANTCIETTESYCTQLGGGFGAIGQLCSQSMCETVQCQGDFNSSGGVDVFDFAILASHFTMGPGLTFAEGDANGDGYVDIFDFGIFAPLFATFCP